MDGIVLLNSGGSCRLDEATIVRASVREIVLRVALVIAAVRVPRGAPTLNGRGSRAL